MTEEKNRDDQDIDIVIGSVGDCIDTLIALRDRQTTKVKGRIASVSITWLQMVRGFLVVEWEAANRTGKKKR